MAASLNRRRLIVFAFFGLLTVAFLAVTAPAVTQKVQHSEAPAALLHIAWDRGDYQAYRNFRDLQAVRIKSYYVLQSALKLNEVAGLRSIKEQEDAVAWLRDRLQIDFPGDNEILRISLKGGDRKEAAMLVNAITKVYLDESVNQQRNGIRQRLNYLQELSSRYENNLRQKREHMRRLRLALGMGNRDAIAIKQRLAKQDILATAKELRSTKMQLLDLESQLKVKQKHKDKEEGASLQERIAVLREKENSLNEAMEQLIKQYPSEQNVELDLESLQEEIARQQSASKKLFDEMETLKIELDRPGGITLLEEAWKGEKAP